MKNKKGITNTFNQKVLSTILAAGVLVGAVGNSGYAKSHDASSVFKDTNDKQMHDTYKADNNHIKVIEYEVSEKEAKDNVVKILWYAKVASGLEKGYPEAKIADNLLKAYDGDFSQKSKEIKKLEKDAAKKNLTTYKVRMVSADSTYDNLLIRFGAKVLAEGDNDYFKVDSDVKSQAKQILKLNDKIQDIDKEINKMKDKYDDSTVKLLKYGTEADKEKFEKLNEKRTNTSWERLYVAQSMGEKLKSTLGGEGTHTKVSYDDTAKAKVKVNKDAPKYR